MGDIIINVEALICEAPIVLHSEWTGARYIFSVDYSSIGDQLSIFDPSVNLELSIDIYENTGPSPILAYSGVINPSAPFNATGYTFNTLDYYFGFSSKFLLRLNLKLTSNESCNETTTYQFPVDYP